MAQGDSGNCEHCGKQFSRGEMSHAGFATRRFCGWGCYSLQRTNAPKSPKARNRSLYLIWGQMHSRCYNPKHVGFHNYGGRGITVCAEWHDFETFLEDMSPRPVGKTLDRIDNDGGYSPANCRWATAAEQSRNTRRARNIEVDGRRVGLTQYCEESGLPYRRTLARLRLGWPVERAISEPVHRRVKRERDNG